VTLTVTVTQEHIERGMPNASTHCPIALALREQHPCEWQWLVRFHDLLRWPGHPIPLPPKAAKFSQQFYLHHTPPPDTKRVPLPKPFTFELEVA
jgi:hypothetical protein